MSLNGTWELLYDAVLEKRLEDAWTRWSLIPPVQTPETSATQLCVYTNSSRLAFLRHQFGGTIAKYPSAGFVNNVLSRPQGMTLTETVLIEFPDWIGSAPLFIQQAKRLNDLTIKIWHRIA